MERYSNKLRVVKSLIGRASTIIEMLAEDARSIRLGEISERLDLPKSATHRLLATLCRIGWVEQEQETGFYRLTLRLAITGQRFLIATRIPDICQPVLDELAHESRELVRMAIIEGEGLTWVAFSQGARSGLVYEPELIAKVPLHATASGKAWLSMLPLDEAMRIVLKDGFGSPDQFGPRCVRSVEALMTELEVTRERGWGLAVEEAELGVTAIAGAIRLQGAKAPVVATVSIAGPLLRFPRSRLEELAGILQATAEKLGRLWPLRSFQPRATRRKAWSAR